MLEMVKYVEPRPPRQLDDALPRELERICLKALSKRVSERYSTAADMAVSTWAVDVTVIMPVFDVLFLLILALLGVSWLGGDCIPDEPTDYAICDISQDEDENGFPNKDGEYVRVTGVSLMESYVWSAARTEFTITDESGAVTDVSIHRWVGE